MPIALAISRTDHSRRKRIVEYAATFTDNYPTGGDTLNFITASNASAIQDAYPHAGVAPEKVEMLPIDGYAFLPVPPSPNAIAGWKLKAFLSEGTEVSAGAYPAGIKDAGAVGNVLLKVTFPQK